MVACQTISLVVVIVCCFFVSIAQLCINGGSLTRVLAWMMSPNFPLSVNIPWLHWGHARIYHTPCTQGWVKCKLFPSSFVTLLTLPICLSTIFPLLDLFCTSCAIRFLTCTLSHTVASNTNACDRPIEVPPSPYSLIILPAMVDVRPICYVTDTILYTTFTWWVPGAESNVVNSVSSPLRSSRSFPCISRKL